MVVMAILNRGNRSATSIEVYHAGEGDSRGKEVRDAKSGMNERADTQGRKTSVSFAGDEKSSSSPAGPTPSCGCMAAGGGAAPAAAGASAGAARAEAKTTPHQAAHAANGVGHDKIPPTLTGCTPCLGNGDGPWGYAKPWAACANPSEQPEQYSREEKQREKSVAKISPREVEDEDKINIPENVKLIRKLGEGVFAMVLLAEIGGRTMAIKTMKPHASYGENERIRQAKIKDAKEGIQSEIDVFEALANRPRHTNIVRYFGHDAHETMIMFEPCMSSLKDFVMNCQAAAGDCEWRLSIENAEKWTAGIFRGLSHLHGLERPIIHRDLKPDNILIDKKGNAKLCDFNLAREIGPRERMAGWLMTGGVGSYRYMAPELLISADHEGSALYGPEVDVYSAAMCIYFMITGQTPFQAKSASSAARKAFSGDRPPWDHVSTLYPSTLTACMVEAWTHKPMCRPSAMNLLRVLTAAQLMNEPNAGKESPRTSKIPGQWQQRARFANLPRTTMAMLKSIEKGGSLAMDKESADATATTAAAASAAVATSQSPQAVVLPWNRPVQTAKFILAATRPTTTQTQAGWAKADSHAAATNTAAVPAAPAQSQAAATGAGMFKTGATRTKKSTSVSAPTSSSASPAGSPGMSKTVSKLSKDSLDVCPPAVTSHVGFSRVLSGLRGAKGRGDINGRGAKARHTPQHIATRRDSCHDGLKFTRTSSAF